MNLATLRRATLCFGLLLLMTVTPGFGQDMSLTEQRATGLSGQWREGQGTVTRGPDGKVVFLFGQVQPSVVCSPLHVCDIELEPGEIVRDVLLGDTVRWKVEPATSGAPGGQAVHLIVKPSEAGLVTSMVVTTSRRTYHIQLKSHATQYMARVSTPRGGAYRPGAIYIFHGHAADQRVSRQMRRTSFRTPSDPAVLRTMPERLAAGCPPSPGAAAYHPSCRRDRHRSSSCRSGSACR